MRIPLNFDDIESQDFDAMPTAVYSAVIEKLVYKPESRKDDGSTKAPNIRVEYTLTEPEYEGRKISQWLYLSEKAMFRAKAWFDAVDSDVSELVLDDETLDDGISRLVVEPDLSGTAVEVKIKRVPKYGDPEKDDNKVDDPPVLLGSKAKAKAAKSKAAEADDDDEEDQDEKPRRRGGRSIR